MSFIDSVKNINQLNVIDEFGGRVSPDKISKFFIVLRVTDKNGGEIEVSFDDVKTAASNG